MFLAVLSCLFIFLGMFIGERFDFKKLSINVIFGLFVLNSIASTLPFVYSCLYKNYHSSTWIFVVLSIILGYLLIKLINCKYEDSDNVSILGFTILNTCLLILHRFNILFLIINIIYYILLGIYIKRSKSWIFVLSGCFLGIILCLINKWVLGFVYGINLSFVIYFILSVYSIVFKSKDKGSLIGLIVGFVVALLGGIL